MDKDTDLIVADADPEGPDETDTEGAKTRKKLEAVHADALMEFNEIQGVMAEERRKNREDREFAFLAGAQWTGDLEQKSKNKPRLEINKTAEAINQIVTDYLNNRIDVSFISKDGAVNKDLADVCAALYRADEQDSNAAKAYANAFREMVAGGMGAWRLKTRYEDPESDDEDRPQRIGVEAIYEADRFVFFDLGARECDKSDARSCFVITPLTHREYARRYPDDDPSSWPDVDYDGECFFEWATPDDVFIAELFRVEYQDDTRCYYAMDDREEWHYGSRLEDNPDIASDLLAKGYQKIREEKVKRRRIHKYLMNGARVLKDYGYIAGTQIPVIPIHAHHMFINGVERCQGHVRKAKDAQRVKNMLVSQLADISAGSSVKKPIVTPGQMEGHDDTWARENVDNLTHVLLNPIQNAEGQMEALPPLGWTEPGVVPPAVGALHQLIDIDLKELGGNVDEGQKVVSHVSGSSIKAIHARVDKKSYLYISDMADGMRRNGQVWLGFAPDIYDQPGRKLKGVGPRNELRQVELQRPTVADTGRLEITNDLRRIKLDVAVEVGPSSESRQEAAMQFGTDMLGVTQDPKTQSVVTLYIMMNMKGEGSAAMREYARRTLVTEHSVLEFATPEEKQALEEAAKNQQPQPIEQLALAQAKEALAKAEKVMADIQLTLAKVEETRVNTAATAASVDLERGKAELDAMKTLADASLARDSAQVDAAKSLQDMAIAAMPPSTPGSNGSS